MLSRCFQPGSTSKPASQDNFSRIRDLQNVGITCRMVEGVLPLRPLPRSPSPGASPFSPSNRQACCSSLSLPDPGHGRRPCRATLDSPGANQHTHRFIQKAESTLACLIATGALNSRAADSTANRTSRAPHLPNRGLAEHSGIIPHRLGQDPITDCREDLY